MEDWQYLLISVILTFSGIIISLFLPSNLKSGFTIGLVILTSIFTSVPAIHAIIGKPIHIVIYGLSFWGNIPVRIDALSGWFILIINFTCINGIIYGSGYMKQFHAQKKNLSFHWILYLIFHTSMLWVCMVQHGLAFLVSWELMSISSLLLIVFEHQKNETLKAGLNYLVQMHISVVFLTVGFIWVFFSQGSFDFNSIGNFFQTNPNVWLFLLFFVGFGIKAGFIPLHSWLPHAHPEAPSHISGVMSGVIVKLGIYGVFRIITFLKFDHLLLGEIILSLSVLTSVFGILNASFGKDFKRMLAYCTIENIGIIGTGIGIGLIGMGSHNQLLVLLGFSGALIHTLNHSLFKSLLFFSAGSVYQQTHTRDMERLGGLIHKMPYTAFLFLIGALAINGLPPFSGFVSEFILYRGYLEGVKSLDLSVTTLMIISLASLALVGGIALLAFTKTFGTIFLGSPRTALKHQVHEVSFVMRLPQFMIILAMLLIGIFPQFFFQAVMHSVNAVTNISNAIDHVAYQPMMSTLSLIGIWSFVFIVFVLVLFLIRKKITATRATEMAPTWGCGYVNPNERMQYTGKSYSKTLGKLLSFLIKEKKHYLEIPNNEIFPRERKHSSSYVDFFETKIIDPLTKRLTYSLNYFQFIQNGRLQSYVLYGIFFIVLIFLGTIFKIF